MPKPILKGGVRVLRPAEYEQLRQGAGTLDNQTRSDALLLTGLRYVEAERLQNNPDWVDGRFMHLPRIHAEEGQEEAEGALGQAFE